MLLHENITLIDSCQGEKQYFKTSCFFLAAVFALLSQTDAFCELNETFFQEEAQTISLETLIETLILKDKRNVIYADNS